MSEHSEYNRKKSIVLGIVYACLALAIYYVFFRYVIYIAWPFAFAALIAVITRKPVVLLTRKLHIPDKVSAAIVTTIVYLLIAGLLTLVVFKAVYAIIDWSSTLPQLYNDTIEPALADVFEWIRSHSYQDAENLSFLSNLGDGILNSIESIVGKVSSKAVTIAKDLAIGVPKAFIGAIFMVVSNYFIAMDYDRISKFFMAQFNPNQQQIIVSSKEFLGVGIGKIIISYLFIMLITFVELAISFKIIGIKNPIVIALLIAIFDLFPVLGTGGVVIPWFIIEFIIGHTGLGLKLLIMYVIITVIRNFIEPKIVGESIGIHPVLMLVSLYLGAIVLGPLGIAILPFTMIVIKKLNDAGLIHIFNTAENKDE